MSRKTDYGCPVELSLDVLGGKWKAVILARIKNKPLRYSELRRLIPALSDKMLTQRLREMTNDRLIERHENEDGVIVYGIGPRGTTLRPVLDVLYQWGLASATEYDVAFADESTDGGSP